MTNRDEEVRARIAARIEELGISRREAARRSGMAESTLRNILVGNSESPRGATLLKIATGLGTTEQALRGEEAGDIESVSTATQGLPSELRMAGEIPLHLGNLPKDVPVMGTVAGSELGKGAFQLTSDIVDYVRRPFGLLGARDIYALYVEGESMVPKFEPGDLVFVHPHKKPRTGDYVVIQEPDSNNGEPRGFIKRLVAVTASLIKTEQFNPPTKIDFRIRPGVVVHKVMNDGELYGA